MAGYAFAGFAAGAGLVDALDFIERARRDEIPHALRRILATAAGNAIELRPDRNGFSWFQLLDYSTVELPRGIERPVSWVAGDPVKLTSGPFADFPGVVDRVYGDRLKVLVEIFGRSVPIETAPGDIVRSRPVPVDGGRRRSA